MMRTKDSMETPLKTPVYLNVYAFCHCCNVICGWAGLGLYHTAIEI